MPVKKRERTTRKRSSAMTIRELNMDQVFVLAMKAGFPPMYYDGDNKPAVEAAAAAYCEHGGSIDASAIGHNTNGSIDVGVWQVNSVHKPDTVSLAAWTRDMQDPVKNAKAARMIWEGAGLKFGNPNGGGGAPWYAYGNEHYAAGKAAALRSFEKWKRDPETMSEMGVVEDITNLKGAAEFGVDVGTWLAGEIGRRAAELLLGQMRWIFRLIWRELLHPQWEHSQRAVVYYWDEIIGDESGTARGMDRYGSLITMLFWGIGFGILWRDAETGDAARDVESTPLGAGVRGIKQMAATRKLHSPKDAKKETPTVPKPRVSQTNIKQQRTARVDRKRTVRVAWDKEEKGPQVSSETTTTEPATEPVKETENVS